MAEVNTLDNPSITIGEMAGKDLRNAEVFKKYGLEFCCDGGKSLEAACKDAGASLEEVKDALSSVPETPVSADKDFNRWNPDFLADYIVNIHHSYVKEKAHPLTELANKIYQVHGDVHPELAEVKDHVLALIKAMISHQEQEETILFPFIKEMMKSRKEGKPFRHESINTVADPVKLMHHDHHAVADHVHAIEKLSDGYKVPADGCNSYKLYYHMLKELDDDLHQHIHLENNILFPKAIQMEKELTK